MRTLVQGLLALLIATAAAAPISNDFHVGGCLTLSRPAQLVFRQRVQTFYTFGDSFTDSGNGAWEASNHTWPSDPAYYQHGFSDGPRWGELVSHALDAKYVNPAAGGATANNTVVRGFTGANSTIPVPSALEQIEATIASVGRFSDDDVVAILIGGNDAGFAPNITAALRKSVLDSIQAALGMLQRAGARHFLLASYPDLSLLPSAIQRNDAAYSRTISEYSRSLAEDVEALSKRPPEGVKYAYLDNYALFQRIVKDPRRYGFDPEMLGKNCLEGVYPVEGKSRSLCEDGEKRLFFDVYHPSKRAHRLVAKEAERVISHL